MVSVSKDNDGKVIGFLEWRQVGQSGFDKFRGEYLWINDLWIHSDYKNSWPIYRQMMNEALFKGIDVKFIYFKREKYEGRIKLYTRERIMKLLERESMSLIKELI